MKIYNIFSPKIRLGNENDGGYIVPIKALEESSCCYSYGVGSDISFDLDYALTTRKPVYCYDHTIEAMPPHSAFYRQFLNFKKEGLIVNSFVRNDNSFYLHFLQNKTQGKCILKIDVEGAEFNFLNNTDINIISDRVCCLIVEFHSLKNQILYKKFINIYNSLCKEFVPCHISGNNYNETFFKNGWKHDIVEMTFIHKDLVKNKKEDHNFPKLDLDGPNNPRLPLVKLNLPWNDE